MHPYIHSKATQARTGELIQQAERCRRVDLLAPAAPHRRPRWPRLLSLFGANRRRDRRPAAKTGRPVTTAPEPATRPVGTEALE